MKLHKPFLSGGCTSDNLLVALGFSTGGSASHFLKADGSVDTNAYSLSNHNHTGVYAPFSHSHSYDLYNRWKLYVNGTYYQNVTSEATLGFTGSGGTTLTWSNGVINIATTGGDNYYADSLSFSGGILTIGRTTPLGDLTQSLDGRYEIQLGNPASNGYVLSSTTGGTRSWIAASGATNLASAPTASSVVITSDTGTDATIVAGTSSLAGILTNGTQTIWGIKTFTQNINAPDFVGTSDERLKTDIRDRVYGNIESNYKQFRFKDGDDKMRFGVIAQELGKKHPEFIRENEDGILSVSYIDLHSAEIQSLKNRVKKLERMLSYGNI